MNEENPAAILATVLATEYAKADGELWIALTELVPMTLRRLPARDRRRIAHVLRRVASNAKESKDIKPMALRAIARRTLRPPRR